MNNIFDTLSAVIRNEDPQDVMLFLTATNRSISYPRIDRLYASSDWPYIGDIQGLMRVIDGMCDRGLLSRSKQGFVKGPHWREPQFLTEKKYKFAP
ncbi:hypothetical protein DFS21_112124 [Pseudomonas sp. 2848]|uniref:hypothetical protein n=1 Tax=Pseudomonas sp. 2848 TaxID=2183926 RepID=UPI000DAE7B9D|nr:hypothetical protein [Pseudomonas sp. 2848]PZW75606.1 hypothetical protein DFS21_112124 [Pseudomonas sp. 2848]